MAIASPDTPLYNSRIFDCYLKLLRKRYAHVSIAELLSHAGIKPLEVTDPGHWFCQRHVDLFYEKLVQLTGNPAIAREAGRYVASPDALGFLREFLLGLAGPELVFSLAGRVAANFTRSSRYVSRKVGPRELEVTVTFEEGVVEHPCQCENRMGFFEAMFQIYGYSFPEIRHSECIFQGDRVCRYHISWDASPASPKMLVRRLSFALLIPILFLAAWLVPGTPAGALLFGLVFLHLGLVLWNQWSERKSIVAAMAGMRASSEEVLGQIQRNYDAALMVNEIGEVVSSRTDLDDILENVNQVLCSRLDYGRGMILIANWERYALELRSCFGLSSADRQALAELAFPLGGEAPQGVMVRCFKERKALLVNDSAEVAPLLAAEHLPLFSSLGVKSFICAPLVCEGEALGVLAVDDPGRDGHLLQSDLSLIQAVSPVIGVAIRNAMRFANERDLSEQLRKASEQLEQRVQERTAELTRANEMLEIVYDSVSHDLRSPLRVIYGYGELLLEGYGDRLDQTGRQYLESMIRGGEQMEATLERMLDFSEVRMMGIRLVPVDLSRLAQGILNQLSLSAPGREVVLQVQQGVVVTGDEALLTSILENLLGNAWKYSSTKKSSFISFGEREGVCFVSDNGAGFDMALAGKLFMPFQRLHDSAVFPGRGLGLAIVRRMVERLGGRIWGEGRPGEGATFYFAFREGPETPRR